MEASEYITDKEIRKVSSQFFKRSTNRLIKKAESITPTTLQAYSDLYLEYIHALDDYFTLCYTLEHRYIENVWPDKNNKLEVFDKLVWNTTSTSIFQIENFSILQSMFLQYQTAAIKSFNTYLKTILDSISQDIPKTETS